MERRDFLKDTVSALAALSVEAEAAGAQQSGGRLLTLGNDRIQWDFQVAGGVLSSIGVTNKLSGERYALRDATELRLTFSAAQHRVEIPSWRCAFGADPKSEFAASDFDDSRWPTTQHPGLPRLADEGDPPRNRPPLAYSGYGWFRTPFELPAASQTRDVVLTLGGYDQTDWLEYEVYVNGMQVGRHGARGRWRTPQQYPVPTEALRSRNVLAVRTHAYDRRFDGWSDDILARYLFNFPHAPNSGFYDQFVTVGQPYAHVSDFEVVSVRPDGPAKIVFEMKSRDGAVGVTLHCELDGSIRRKWAEVTNKTSERKLLLDVDLDRFATDSATADGGYGFPVTIGGDLFCAVEHPSGLNRGDGAKVSVTHFPGRWLEPGKTWRSHSAIVGVAPAGETHHAFHDYLTARTVRRKKFLALYDSLGITAFPLGMNWTLNEEQNLRTIELLAEWSKKGLHFDYYSPELSTDMTSSGDLKRLKLFSFPDGPERMLQGMRAHGLAYGQYFSICGGNWSIGRNPAVTPCRMPEPGPPKVVFRHGYAVSGTGILCPAAEPYFTMLKDAVAYHCREHKAALLKFDIGRYYCLSTTHQHLPGKYSTEEHYNRLIELAATARAANPDVMIMWYWGAYSPFFALHGDVIQDTRIDLEAASTGDYPSLFFRDSVTQAVDQATQFAKWLPPINHDSLGTWLANNAWGNFMGCERWQEAAVMDLGRGSLLFPQIWSDIYQLEDHDVRFLARIQRVARENQQIFLERRRTLGDAWKDDIYGYSFFKGNRGFVFLNNMSFESRRYRLELGSATGGALRLHFPEEAILEHGGDPVEIQLRPFEVMMIEARPAAPEDASLPRRAAVETSPVYSYRVPVRPARTRGDLEIAFADAADLEKRGGRKAVAIFECDLPGYSGGRHHLAVVSRFRKRGQRWRQQMMSQFVQAIATCGGVTMEFARTPDYRQVLTQWSPWIVFSAPLPRAFAGRRLELGITSYLPPEVEMDTEVWVVKEWWRPRTRPIPNYWI